MTVAELIKELKKCPQTANVILRDECDRALDVNGLSEWSGKYIPRDGSLNFPDEAERAASGTEYFVELIG